MVPVGGLPDIVYVYVIIVCIANSRRVCEAVMALEPGKDTAVQRASWWQMRVAGSARAPGWIGEREPSVG